VKKLTLLIVTAAVLCLVVALYLLYYIPSRTQVVRLKVFCAGSLKGILDEFSEIFEKKHSNVVVEIEASGSVVAVRKVTELGKLADVVAVADYTLIPELMMPKYASWYVVFATNEIVLTYTDKSKYANEISSSNWLEILLRPGVRFGFSNPNDDPCGYRAVMVLTLASKYYSAPQILDLLQEKTNLRIEYVNGTYHIYVPPNFKSLDPDRIVIRGKSIELVALLQAGVLDYAFEYRSVAIQKGLKYIELPPEINLGSPKLRSKYGKVIVHLFAGSEKEKVIIGKPIIYGITVPLNAPHRELALKFVELLISDVGREVFERNGQPPLVPPLGFGEVPEDLRRLVVIGG